VLARLLHEAGGKSLEKEMAQGYKAMWESDTKFTLPAQSGGAT